MNRLDRVTAILVHLQSRKIVKAEEIAERFDISIRTVYRDIRTLEEAGIPLIGEVGVGYSIMDGYKLPPIMLTQDEATAFLTAEKLVDKLTDASTRGSYKSALYKIKAVLRSTEKDHLENMEKHIEVVENPYLPKDVNAANPLQTILKSIATKTVLNIDYFANSSQEKTKRNIEPVGVFLSGSYWHVIAYCQMRKDYRDFRTDRISKISFTEQLFKKEHPPLKTYLKKITKEKELHAVTILFDKKILRYIGEQKYYNGFVSQKEVDDQIEMTFLTQSLEGFARWFIMYGDMAEIIQPASLKKRVKQLATVISKK